jgi:hypothetical protein
MMTNGSCSVCLITISLPRMAFLNFGQGPYKDASGFNLDNQALVFKIKLPIHSAPFPCRMVNGPQRSWARPWKRATVTFRNEKAYCLVYARDCYLSTLDFSFVLSRLRHLSIENEA